MIDIYMLAIVQTATWQPEDAHAMPHLAPLFERLILKMVRGRGARRRCADGDSVPMRA